MFFKTISAAIFVVASSLGAQAVTFGGLQPDQTKDLAIGDVFSMEIHGNATDGAGMASYGFTALSGLIAIETNSLNPNYLNGKPAGFQDVSVEWNTKADGSGSVLASIYGDALRAGQALVINFLADETKYLIARWAYVSENGANLDLRVAAHATPVPVPAGGLLLLGALAGTVALRRRRRG